MIKYNLDRFDFKRYMVDLDKGFKVEELIFWKNRIPLPLDIVYSVFDKREDLCTMYLDHLAAAILYDTTYNKYGRFAPGIFNKSVDEMPESISFQKKNDLESYFKTTFLEQQNQIDILFAELSGLFDIPQYSVEISKVCEALNHNGKKYSRIYIPERIKRILLRTHGTLLSRISISNNDMFGNIIADYFNIYRSGFSDAMSSIFNCMLDFLILFSTKETQNNNIRAERIQIAESSITGRTNLEVELGHVLDGSLWEPIINKGQICFRLNTKHLFKEKVIGSGTLALENNKALLYILKVLSELELSSYSDKESRKIENLRQLISRELRIITEEL